jgi:tetratricopeptide (TPR) repeat protein
MKQKKLSFVQKIIVLTFGIFIGLLALEGILRFVGLPQEGQQQISRKKEGDFTILCLGESTTAGQWPPILQEILDDAGLPVTVQVISEGKRDMNTGVIVHNLADQLNQYDPDMVIAMMGVNDREDTIEVEVSLGKRIQLFFQDYRVYKLAKSLWMKTVYKVTGERSAYADEEPLGNLLPADITAADYTDALNQAYMLMNGGDIEGALAIVNAAIAVSPHLAEGYIRRAWLFERKNRNQDALNDLKKAYELQSDDVRTILEYATYLKRNEMPNEADALLREAYSLDQDDPWLLREMGELLYRKKEFSEAEKVFKKVIMHQPENPDVYMFLGRIYATTAQFQQALEYFKKGVSRKPEYVDFIVELVECHLALEEYDEAVLLLRRAQELEPMNVRLFLARSHYFQEQSMYDKQEEVLEAAYTEYPSNIDVILALIHLHMYMNNTTRAQTIIEEALKQPAIARSDIRKDLYFSLTKVYVIHEEFDKAQDVFGQALDEFPNDARLNSAFALFCLNRDEAEKADQYFQKAEKIKSSRVNATTKHNYNRLKDLLGERGVQLVAVQYPMRNVSDLKRLLGNDEHIIFVDNEKVFKDAVLRDGYETYFWDNFGGDFGHCTDKGNRLLAENIAQTIIREYFER